MKRFYQIGIVVIGLIVQLPLHAGQQAVIPVTVRSASVDGVTISYRTAGKGPAVVLLHGYAQTSRMWAPLIPQLAARFTVIAPDLPGIGESDIPSSGLDMKTSATRIRALVQGLGVGPVVVVGHDIGLMVAYAYAAQYPADVQKLVLMDAFVPGVDGWESVYNNAGIWHFRFNGPTPEALVAGRERTFFEHFWNNFAANGTRSISEADRQAYTAAYARPGRMRAGWEYFKSFEQTAMEFSRLAQRKLPMPLLTIGGDKAFGEVLRQQGRLIATTASAVVIANTGHWVIDESPKETIDALVQFLVSGNTSSLAEMRFTPSELRASPNGKNQIGSSLLNGVSTRVLFGDPAKPGPYAILLSVGSHTTIPAHSHRDDRMATVVSGTWRFGYGERFNEQALKTLPVGSVYSEPGGGHHFAQTTAEPVLLHISGYGPTDTKYFNPSDTPGTRPIR